jgi:Leucine-rich repeat (LRR) protein/membrane-associated phospholipid phosphatase
VLLGLLVAGTLAAASGWSAPPLNAPLLAPQDGLLTATFSERTDDAALKASIPALAAQGVEAIHLRGAPVTDLRPLTGLTGLQLLDLRGTQVRDLTPLANLRRLRDLDLEFLRINDVRPLAGLTGLRSLNLCGTEIRDLTPLGNLTGLQELVLSVTKVKELSPLAALRQLRVLDVSGTWVDDIQALSGMTGLHLLNLNGTSITDIQPLSSMTQLRTLDLGGTQVHDIRPLAGLRSLHKLDLESTPVSDVSPLVGLVELQSLSLGGSRVSDLSPLAGLAIAPALGAQPTPVTGDPVLYWNDQTNWAIQATRMDPFMAARALALESLAVLDTLRSLHGEPGFLVRLPSPGDVPDSVAVAAAAHAMLSHLFPSRQAALDAALAAEMTTLAPESERRSATEFGRAVADAVFMMREGDGWDSAVSVRIGQDPGEWRPTPPRYLPPMDPQWATMAPLALTRPDQFRPAGPPPPGSAAFHAGRDQVSRLGAQHSTERTADQTEIAHYWSDAIGTYAPAGHWNAIAASIIGPTHAGLENEAELFAELNVAMSDASIAIADAKYAFRSWRPITAIREGDLSDPPDPTWTPLLDTPNHPSYISGHSTLSGAAAEVLTRWFGERSFTFSSASLPGVTRSFSSFEQAAEEAAASRVYGGIHFPFDNTDGLATGRKVGRWVLEMLRRPPADRGPFLMVDRGMEPLGPDGRLVTGCALNNVDPVTMLTAKIDDGAPFQVPVDQHGLFAMRPPVHASGLHRLQLTAVSATGQKTSVGVDVEVR